MTGVKRRGVHVSKERGDKNRKGGGRYTFLHYGLISDLIFNSFNFNVPII